MTASDCRLILRAEVEYSGNVTVANTIAVSSQHLLIQMDRWPAMGIKVVVRLSFPRLLEPLVLRGRVARHHAPAAPGDIAGITVELEQASSAAASSADLAALLARVNTETPPSFYRAPSAPVNGYRILLVEDNLTIRDMFVYGVSRYFHGRSRAVSVDMADDGEQAWNMLCSHTYDIAIVDCYLPVLDGASLVSHLRHDGVLQHLPVVGISAGGSDARVRMLGAGVDLYLSKPIVLRDLFSTLERLTAERLEIAS